MKIELVLTKGEKRNVAKYETNNYVVSARFEIDDMEETTIEDACMKAFSRMQKAINAKQTADGVNPRSPIVDTQEKVEKKVL
jgi:hypothetical protein